MGINIIVMKIKEERKNFAQMLRAAQVIAMDEEPNQVGPIGWSTVHAEGCISLISL